MIAIKFETKIKQELLKLGFESKAEVYAIRSLPASYNHPKDKLATKVTKWLILMEEVKEVCIAENTLKYFKKYE